MEKDTLITLLIIGGILVAVNMISQSNAQVASANASTQNSIGAQIAQGANAVDNLLQDF